MGERKNLKLAWCEQIVRMVLKKGYSLNELRKPDFDYIFSVATNLMRMRDGYTKREQATQTPNARA